jgi:flagellar operon protein
VSSDSFLYPNITRLPGQVSQGNDSPTLKEKRDLIPGEFDQILNRTLEPEKELGFDLRLSRSPLKFSSHAMQRLQERKIKIEPPMMEKISKAVDQASQKGVEEALILTPDAALIVGVKSRTVITAVDRGSMSGSVFTNIDGAVIV